MPTNHDETEWAIQRKGRSQTEGLTMFDAVIIETPAVICHTDETWASIKMPEDTTHPDSVAGSSQAGHILRHLQSVGSLTSLDALRLFGCARLAARVADLRSKGYTIQSRFVTVGANKRVSEYSLRA